MRYLLTALLLVAPFSGAETDPRQAYLEGVSPAWLRAVGRLEIPGIRTEDGRRRHHTERCSATLVGARPGVPADTIVTAWHCLEYYEDLSRRIVFSLAGENGAQVHIEARRLEDGGGMEADWAILRLRQPVPRQGLMPAARRDQPGANLVMAGYSRDEGVGRSGKRLSYDPACRVTEQTRTYSDSDCRAYKGSSGGAVIQLSDSGEPQLTGVISEGNGEGLSRFIPVSTFRRTLARYLR